jgi:hypothetical protein
MHPSQWQCFITVITGKFVHAVTLLSKNNLRFLFWYYLIGQLFYCSGGNAYFLQNSSLILCNKTAGNEWSDVASLCRIWGYCSGGYEDVKQYSPAGCLLHADVFLGLLFKPEDIGSVFLRKIGWFSRTSQRHMPEDGNRILLSSLSQILRTKYSVRNTLTLLLLICPYIRPKSVREFLSCGNLHNFPNLSTPSFNTLIDILFLNVQILLPSLCKGLSLRPTNKKLAFISQFHSRRIIEEY